MAKKKPQKEKKKRPKMTVGGPEVKLPKSLMAGVGEVISMWSVFENTSSYLSACAFGQTDHKPARLMFITTDWIKKKDIFEQLCKKHEAENALNALEKLNNKAEKLRMLRNRLAHGVWSRSQTGKKTLHVVQFKGSHEGFDMRIWPKRFYPKTSDLVAAAEDIRDLTGELEDWYDQYWEDLSPPAVEYPEEWRT